MPVKSRAAALTAEVVAYHLTVLIQDRRRAKTNWRRFRQQPSASNLRRLLLAEGVLAADFEKDTQRYSLIGA